MQNTDKFAYSDEVGCVNLVPFLTLDLLQFFSTWTIKRKKYVDLFQMLSIHKLEIGTGVC